MVAVVFLVYREGFAICARHLRWCIYLVILNIRQSATATHAWPHTCTSYVLNVYLYCVYALVGGAISIRDPYICAVSRVCANESHAVFHGPVVCAV